MPYCDVVNHVTVTKTNMIDEIPCGYGTLRTIAVRIQHQVSRRPGQVSAAPIFDYPNSKIMKHSECTSINGRCFLVHVRMLLHSLRAVCKSPGGAGSIWKYLEALVRAARVSGRFAYRFRTELHFADNPLCFWNPMHYCIENTAPSLLQSCSQSLPQTSVRVPPGPKFDYPNRHIS